MLCYTRENEYRHAARVIGKEHNPELGDGGWKDMLWDVTDERLESLKAQYGDVDGFIDAIRE